MTVATMTSRASSVNPFDPTELATRVAELRDRIAATGADPQAIRLVAVTKTFGVEAVRAAVDAGLTAVGENYVDELEEKRAAGGNLAVRWHYLGALQSNKIARVARVADVVSGVSRPKEIERLAQAAPALPIDIQVDYTGASGRNGAAPDDVAALVGHARASGLTVRGLMTVAPADDRAPAAFRALAALADECGVPERSMGMSDDFLEAVRWGSTEIRVGRALFGPRVPPRALA